jgi:hypothetical protein
MASAVLLEKHPLERTVRWRTGAIGASDPTVIDRLQPGDPLLLFSVLYGVFIAYCAGFNADLTRDIAAHTLELPEKQSASFPQVLGHNNLGGSLTCRRNHGSKRTFRSGLLNAQRVKLIAWRKHPPFRLVALILTAS